MNGMALREGRGNTNVAGGSSAALPEDDVFNAVWVVDSEALPFYRCGGGGGWWRVCCAVLRCVGWWRGSVQLSSIWMRYTSCRKQGAGVVGEAGVVARRRPGEQASGHAACAPRRLL